MEEMNLIISLAGVVSAVAALMGIVFAIYRWYLKQERQDGDISKIKEENALIVYSLSAVLQPSFIQGGEDGCGEELKSEADSFFELALARASRRYKASQGVELCQKSGRI